MSLLEQRQKIVDHLTQQRKQAKYKEEVCAYRSDDGLMCAVGCLIPDEIYSPEIEGITVDALAATKHDLVSSFINSLSISVDELSDWQWYHDCDYENWCELSEDSLSPSYFAHKMSKKYGG